MQKSMLVRILCALILLLFALIIFHNLTCLWYIELLVYAAIYLLIGYDIVLKAIGGIGRGQLFDENFLMVLATIGAFATEQYPEAVSVMLLYQVGEMFQRYAVGKSRNSISDLMNLRPDVANVLRDGEAIQVLPENVKIGETILVRPGERVALDGIVYKGESALDTSALTGESAPRYCRPGDEILSGTIVSSGALEIRVEKEFYDSTVSKILDLVENASAQKAVAEKFITKFARLYTPVVVGLALLLALLPPLVDGAWNVWVGRAMNFLVVSCPCALVISVPMSFFAGIGAASSKGVLIKGGSYLELLNRADIFVFDKTGTLTKGEFSVIDVNPSCNKEEILRCAAIAEQMSLHPIARAILRVKDCDDTIGWSIEEKAGHGVCARKNSCEIVAGNENYLKDFGVEIEPAISSGTIVYVAKDGILLGHIEIGDELKADAVSVVSFLGKQKTKTVMLTGDRLEAAQRVAKEVGVDDFRAGLLPGDKVAYVEKLLDEKQKHSVLAFVGDGINDAPVLMRADIGIAMGAIGSDAAIEAADVVLMYDDLSSIVAAKCIARKTMAIVMQNIVFALTVKLMVLALTPFGLVSVWLAIFADVGVAILAILNAMRAGRID